ncbi:hypothetical protein EBS02_07235 [bacterium]|nr:hypothetical protein [bacterium]
MNRLIILTLVGYMFHSGVNAQSQLLPSPSSLVISAGMWLYQDKTKPLYLVEVESRGSNFEEARTEGFRLAVEHAVGSLLLSNTEINNGKIDRREIINYASGYIDKFEILTKREFQGTITIQMKVWVSQSQIASRLLHQSKANTQIEGPRASAQISSLIKERQTGDNAVTSILRDFPQRSFDISIGKTSLTFDSNRNPSMKVDFKIKWNYDYLMGLLELLESTSQGKAVGSCRYMREPTCQYESYIHIRTKIPNKFLFSKRDLNFGYYDFEKFKIFVDTFLVTNPAILIVIKNSHDQTVSKECYRWVSEQYRGSSFIAEGLGAIISSPGSKIFIDGWTELNLQAPIYFNQSLSHLETLSKVDIDVVRGDRCPKF